MRVKGTSKTNMPEFQTGIAVVLLFAFPGSIGPASVLNWDAGLDGSLRGGGSVGCNILC